MRTSAAESIFQAALLALLLLALGAGSAWLGKRERQAATLDAEQSATRLRAARARLTALQDPEAERLAGQLAELSAQGFFSVAMPDYFLDDRLQEARIALGMTETRAVFSPPQRWGDDAARLWQGELELELNLNHEQEFADFWRILKWPGPMRLTDCTLERNPARAAAHAPPRSIPNLKAACRLQWLTGSPATEDDRQNAPLR
ncbi:MAG: hypothetical protein LBU11_08115 [Zoogloeaceae bacterium]|jgi:hypothetical protein|nr:hypothetical protein [Zoogloeaceae bacterium]